MPPVLLNVRAGDSARQVPLAAASGTLSKFLGELQTAFGAPAGSVSYTDPEGDVCRVTSDAELRAMLQVAVAQAPTALSVSATLAPGDDEWSVVATPVSATLSAAAPPAAPTPATAAAAAAPAPAAGANVKTTSRVTFSLNGRRVVLRNPDPTMMLVDYIRDVANLKGTKIGCREGGCGACTVLLSWRDAQSGTDMHRSVNSCLRPVCAVDGMAVTTVEGIGSQASGFHPIQARLAANSGTQCGFCSPGWVMSMYGVLREDAAPSGERIQKAMDGNLCRCTGYRPILEAFQTFSCDSSSSQAADVEDLAAEYPYAAGGEPALPAAVASFVPAPLAVSDDASGKTWLRPTGLPQVLDILREHQGEAVQLVRGNTSQGVTKYLNDAATLEADQFDVFVDVNRVPEMAGVRAVPGEGLQVGATVSLTDLIAALRAHAGPADAKDRPSLFSIMADHLEVVANTGIRNAASWAGNVMLTKRHRAFPSDVVLTLAMGGAQLSWLDSRGNARSAGVMEFLEQEGRADVVLVSATIPFPAPAAVARSWKIAQRHVNAHAHCNAGFNVTLADDGTVQAATLVFGGASARTFAAYRTAAYLRGRALDEDTLAGALELLGLELAAVGPNPAFGSQGYREALLQNLTYKFFLYCQPDLPPHLQSAVAFTARPVSTGEQEFETDESEAPVSMPVPKLTGTLQCSGEAEYTADEPLESNALHGAWVCSQRALATVLSIDAAPALAMEGVVDIVTAADVPGSNSLSDYELLFVPVGGVAQFVGDAVALVLAESPALAYEAARRVAVQYGPAPGGAQPVLTVEEAVAAGSFFDSIPEAEVIEAGDPDAAIATAPHVVSGSIKTGNQIHFYMEPQTALAYSVEGDNMECSMSTQHAFSQQPILAAVLGLPQNKLNVKARRAGGGFGGKGNRAIPAAAAALVASRKHGGQQVLVVNDRTVDMARNAGRQSLQATYTVGFDDEGVIQGVVVDYLMAAGCTESPSGASYMGQYWADNAYKQPNYRWSAKLPKLNIAPSTSCRAPGVVQTTYVTEALVEHVAAELGLPPDEVRAKNFYEAGDVTPYGQELKYVALQEVWDTLKAEGGYDAAVAEAEAFNAANRWVKRGVHLSPIKYGISNAGYQAAVVLTCAGDGTVRATTSGAEIGQGLLTKVAQAIAYKTGAPLASVAMDAQETKRTPGGGNTGGSGTSEACVAAALDAGAALNALLEPFADAGDSFADRVAAAIAGGVFVQATGWYNPPEEAVFQYYTYVAAQSVVELDVLTGQLTVESSKIVYDCGQSLNPAIDIGQIEGAFIQGLGYFHTESVSFAEDTGRMQTLGTWEYKPPSALDVPLQLDVKLLPNNPNVADGNVLGSKATGEPPYAIANSVLFAAKHAVDSARADAGLGAEFVQLPVPADVSALQGAAGTDASQFVLS